MPEHTLSKDERIQTKRVGFYIRQPTRNRINRLKELLADIHGRTVSQDDAVWWMLEQTEAQVKNLTDTRQKVLTGLG